MSRSALVLLAVVAVLGFWMLGAYNRLVRLRGAVVFAWLAVDEQLRLRHALAHELAANLAAPAAQAAVGDEIGVAAVQMLVAAVRQAEAAAAQARLRPAHAGSIQSLALAEQVLDHALRPLPALIAARAPGLESAGVHAALGLLLAAQVPIEARAGFVRGAFNKAVDDFNAAVDEMPTCLLAGGMRFRPAAHFLTVPARALPEPAPP